MNEARGIDLEQMKNIYRLFIDYHNEITKIFNEYKMIINNSNQYFDGNIANKYKTKFNNFSDQLDIVSKSLQVYADSIYSTCKKYTDFDFTALDVVSDSNGENNKFLDNVK